MSAPATANIPAELKKLKQWMHWRWEIGKDGKPTKPPINPFTNLKGNKINPDHWTTFDDAVRRQNGNDGLGWVFTKDDPYAGIDLDGCRNKETGKLQPWADRLVKKINSYTEVSPSGLGVKIWIVGKSPLPKGKKRKLSDKRIPGCEKEAGIEIYDHAAYFCVTGQRLPGLPDEPQERQDVLDELCREYWPAEFQLQHKHFQGATATSSATSSSSSPTDVLERARKYLATMDPAISGKGGHNQTFKVACILVLGFGLPTNEAMVLMREYNSRCEPQWSEQELQHKVDDADREPGPRGDLRDAERPRICSEPPPLTEEQLERKAIQEEGRRGTRTDSERIYASYPEGPEQPPHPAEDLINFEREASQGESKPRPWESPAPFFVADLPEFPVHALPTCLGNYVSALATAAQTPVDLPAMLALPVVAAALAKKIEVQVREGFVEPVNLYTVTAIASANRKSAIFGPMLDPLEEYEAAEARRMAPEIGRMESRYKILERTLLKTQEAAAKSSNAQKRGQLTGEADELAEELAQTRIPLYPRLLADDCSPERLATLMRDHGGRLMLASAEGDLFEIMAGRYSANGAPNLGVYLRGHSGDTLRVDRVNRPPEYIRKPALTIALTVQPTVIEGLSDKPEFRGKGLLARFLYSFPKSPLGKRKADAPPAPEEIARQYNETITRLLELPLRVDEDGNAVPRTLQLDPGALTSLVKFMQWLEPQLAPLGELGFISDWAGKLAGAVARIAGLLHMAEHTTEARAWELPVSDRTVDRALLIAEYLISHAKAAFGEMGADPEVNAAKHILAWINKMKLGEFTKRDAFNACRGRFRKAVELDPALTLLVEQGYIREKPVERESKPGRKPSPDYEVNPNCADCA